MSLGTPVVLSTINSATDANAYAGTSGTPNPSERLIAIVNMEQTTSDPTIPTVANSPWGLTWTRDTRGDNLWTTGGATNRRGCIFTAVTSAGSQSADTFDVDFGGVTQIGCEAIVLRMPGAVVRDPSGAAAMYQLQVGQDGSTPYTMTLNAPNSGENRALAFYAVNLNTDIIHDSGGGWTEIVDQNHLTPTISIAAHWKATGFDTTLSATTGANQVGGQWGIEVVAELPQDVRFKPVPFVAGINHRSPI